MDCRGGTSTLTIVSVPGLAFGGDFRFFQLLGYRGKSDHLCFADSHYFRGDLLTAYGLIDRRFGQLLSSLTAGLFLLPGRCRGSASIRGSIDSIALTAY